MARTTTMDSIDAKIKAAEERVIKTGGIYNAACEDLKKLRDKKAALEGEALVAAFIKSNKTLEETITFLESDTVEEVPDQTPAKRRGRRKKNPVS